MTVATLILTLTIAGVTGEQRSEHPSLADCERIALGMVSAAPAGWVVSFECLEHIRLAPGSTPSG